MATDAGTALTALMHSANIASAVAPTGLYLHYGFFLLHACVRACVRACVTVSCVRDKTALPTKIPMSKHSTVLVQKSKLIFRFRSKRDLGLKQNVLFAREMNF